MLGLVLDDEGRPILRKDLPKPTPGPLEVLVRVTHTTINGHEFALARSPLVRGLAWLRGAPGRVRTGLEFAGIVASDGHELERGTRVMGYVDMIAGWKTHGEFIAIPRSQLARVPADLTMAEAATLPMGGQTALVALRDVAAIGAGQRVLIFGASGGVGVMALQIAAVLGARVTAVASPRHRSLLEDLGADELVDPEHAPPESMRGRYDAILDFTSTLPLRRVRQLLGERGVFVPADPLANLRDIVLSRRTRWLMVDRGDAEHLEQLARWVEDGQLRAVVDQVHDLEQWQVAVDRGYARGKAGRVVLHLDADEPARARAMAFGAYPKSVAS